MITIANYEEKKNSLDWKALPKNINDTRSDVEDIMEFYNDDDDIKETVDLFFKGINNNLPKAVDRAKIDSFKKENPIVIKDLKPSAPLFLRNDIVKLKPSTKIEDPYLYQKYGDSDLIVTSVLSTTKGDLIPGQKTPIKSTKYTYVVKTENTNTTDQIDEEYLDHVRKANAITNKKTKTNNTTNSTFEKLYELAQTEPLTAKEQWRVMTSVQKVKFYNYIKSTDAAGENNYEGFIYLIGGVANLKKETLQDVFLDSLNTRKLMPKMQQMAVLENDESEEVQYFIDKVKEFERIFVDISTNRQETKTIKEAIVYAHYFYGDTHWFITEYLDESDEFFGYVVLNGDTQNSEAGYISIPEILKIKGIELDFYYTPKNLAKELKTRYPGEYEDEEVKPAAAVKTATKKAASVKPAAKVKVVVNKTIVDNLTAEFLLIRRFWNLIKKEDAKVPFRTVQLVYMAFNKAAVERKVRKTSEAAELFTKCNKKIIALFEGFPNEDKKPFEIEFTDKGLYGQIQEYVTDVAVNPAIPVLKRFIAMQNTKPDVKKVATLVKAIQKVIADSKENRLRSELIDAKNALELYATGGTKKLKPEYFGLSQPRVVCTNRIKCAGIDKTGKLHKGYKFQEHTGNVIRVRKTAAKKKTGAIKKPLKKKVVAGLGLSDSLEFNQVERIYTDNTPVIPVVQVAMESVLNDGDFDTSEQETGTLARPGIRKEIIKPVKNKLMDMKFDSLNLDQGWEKFMQNPAKNMKVAIWGAPKNGKTAGSLQLANYLTKFGKVLYNFADQGFNKSTQDLWKQSGLANNPKAEPSDTQTLSDLEKEIATGKYSFVFIDMISDYINKENIKPYEFKERFMKKYPNVSFILIFEVTKGGNFKGDQGWTHIVDAIVTVENFLMENRGRYGLGSHIVWEDGLKRFDHKKYEEVIEELKPKDELVFSQEVERI